MQTSEYKKYGHARLFKNEGTLWREIHQQTDELRGPHCPALQLKEFAADVLC